MQTLGPEIEERAKICSYPDNGVEEEPIVLGSAQIPCTLPTTKTKPMVSDFGFSFLFLPFSKEKVAFFQEKSRFSFWFQLSP